MWPISRFLWSRYLPDYLLISEPHRVVAFAVVNFSFFIAASFYMNFEMGFALMTQTRAINELVAENSFHFYPIAYDLTAIPIGMLREPPGAVNE